MTTDTLYSIASKENIDINDYKWSNTKARIFEIDNQYSIAIDFSKINDSIEEKEILAEELRSLLLQRLILS